MTSSYCTLYMFEPGNRASLVTRQILLSVHIGNFGLVDQDEIQETQPG